MLLRGFAKLVAAVVVAGIGGLAIGRIRGELGPAQMHQLDAALAIALGLD